MNEWQLQQQDIPIDDYVSLLDLAEQLKCKLNGNEPHNLIWSWQDKQWQFSLNENQFKSLWLPLINHLRAPVEQVLSDARLKPSGSVSG